MRKLMAISVVTLCLTLMLSCAKNTASSGPHATVSMRDGSSYSGTVVSSSPAEITVAGDDKTTRTIQMKDVSSIDYSDQNVAQQPGGTPGSVQPPAAGQVSEPPSEHYHPEVSNIRSRTLVVPAGADISVRTDEAVDSGSAVQGQTYAADITRDVLDANGDVVIPRGANAQVVIRSASSGGRIRGASDLVLTLQSVSVGGRQYQLSTTDIAQQGREGIGKNKRTGEFGGGGAAIGAIIGAIAGHGKGAAIGAASGAVAGMGAQVLTKGNVIRVPAESILTFRLDQPLRIVQAQ